MTKPAVSVGDCPVSSLCLHMEEGETEGSEVSPRGHEVHPRGLHPHGPGTSQRSYVVKASP